MSRCLRPALFVLLLIGLMGCKSATPAVSRAGELPLDAKAEDAFRLGTQYFRVNNWTQALNFFTQAAERPLHRMTTAARYMQALTLHNAGQADAALEAYQRLIVQYPQSQYVPEANYHKALLLIERPEQREAALWLLLNLAEQTERADLRADATAAADRFLFEQATVDFLLGYQKKVRASWRPRVTEALVYRLQREGAEAEWRRVISAYEKSGGTLTPALTRLAGTKPSAAGVRTQLRVAVVLPFAALKQDSTFDATSAAALELLQGLRLALDSLAYPGLADVDLRVLDSADDSLEVLRLVERELKPYEPHVVIGDLRNRPTRALARAAQQHGWLHLVPLSDADEFITAPPADAGTVLVNPSQGTTAERLGQYVRRWHPGGRVIVAHDQSAASRRLADRFVAQVAGTDIRVVQRVLASYVPLAIDQFKELSGSLRVDSADAVYLPIHNEELVSFALFRLSNDSVNVQVLGMDRWRGYRSLDPEMLSRLRAIIPDLYGDADDVVGYERFRAMYLRAFRALPTTYAVQGYDLMRVLLTAVGRSRPDASPWQALQGLGSYRGLNKRYRFDARARDNQSVPLVEYRFGQAERVPFAE